MAQTNNQKFARITKKLKVADIVLIFNTPNDLGITRQNVHGWRCTDKTRPHYRGMSSAALELYKLKVGLIQLPSA